MPPWSKIKIKRPFTLSATTVSNTVLQTVWNAIRPRDDQTSFRRFYADIRAVEGTEDTSFIAVQMKDALENDGKGTRNTVVHAGTTACVVLTAFTFGLVYFVLSLAL